TGAKLRAEFEHTNPKDTMLAGVEVNGYPPLPGEEQVVVAAVTLEQLSERFIEMKSPHWAKKTVMDNRRVLALTLRVLGGETPITSVDKVAVRGMRDAVIKLPSSYMKRKDQVDLDLAALFASD